MKNTAATPQCFTRVKPGAVRLKLASVAVLAVLFGLSLVACNNPAGDTPPAPAPESVTITLPSNMPAGGLPQGSSSTFTATVKPDEASQNVTWSVEPNTATISKEGRLTLGSTAVGATVTVKATATGTDKFDEKKITVIAPIAPTKITVDPATATIGAGGKVQFSVKVEPAFASEAVTWSVESGEGYFANKEKGELSVDDGAEPDSTITVQATSVIDTSVSGTATVTVAKPVTITITEIPAGYSYYEIMLWKGNSLVARGGGQITGDKVESTLYEEGGLVIFTTAGTYDVALVLENAQGGESTAYRTTTSKAMAAGNNTIAFSDFKELPPISITITGLPLKYVGRYAYIELAFPGTKEVVGDDWVEKTAATQQFTVVGAAPGTYDVILELIDGTFIAQGKAIAASGTTIAFGGFTLIPPDISVTVTGLAAAHNGKEAEMLLLSEPQIAGGSATAFVANGSVTFLMYDIDPDTYNIRFEIGEDRYTLSNKALGATNTIALSTFTYIPVKIRVTIRGIPEHEGNSASLSISGDAVGDHANVDITAGKAVFPFYEAEPNKSYDLTLHAYQSDGGVVEMPTSSSYYSLKGKTLGENDTIDFTDFTLVSNP